MQGHGATTTTGQLGWVDDLVRGHAVAVARGCGAHGLTGSEALRCAEAVFEAFVGLPRASALGGLPDTAGALLMGLARGLARVGVVEGGEREGERADPRDDDPRATAGEAWGGLTEASMDAWVSQADEQSTVVCDDEWLTQVRRAIVTLRLVSDDAVVSSLGLHDDELRGVEAAARRSLARRLAQGAEIVASLEARRRRSTGEVGGAVPLVTQVDEDELERAVEGDGGPVLVHFSANWCAPCQAMLPVLEEEARRWQGRVRVLEVDVDQSPSAAMRHRIKALPTFVLFERGAVAASNVGATSAQRLSAWLDEALQGG